MFFKKHHSQEEVEVLETEKPFYILGNGALALFLAARIQSSGKKVFLLTPSAPIDTPQFVEFSLKEEYNLQKKQLKIPMVSHVHYEPECFVVASDYHNLKSHLTLLPSKRYPHIPLVCFNCLQSFDILRPIMGENFVRAYFKGYLFYKSGTLLACGSQPELVFSAKEDLLPEVKNFIDAAELKVQENENDLYNFWTENAPFMAAYLTLFPKQHISELLSASENKQKILSVIHELSQLAKSDNVKLNEDYMIRQLIDTPRNFYHKETVVGRLEQTTLLDCYYNLLLSKARSAKCKIPVVSKLVKENYDALLNQN